MTKNYPLTDAQANFIKDILKAIGRDDTLNDEFAGALGMGETAFDTLADSTFQALGNGRITVLT